jgi:hypothetical protein
MQRNNKNFLSAGWKWRLTAENKIGSAWQTNRLATQQKFGGGWRLTTAAEGSTMLATILIFVVLERWLIYSFNKLGEVFNFNFLRFFINSTEIQYGVRPPSWILPEVAFDGIDEGYLGDPISYLCTKFGEDIFKDGGVMTGRMNPIWWPTRLELTSGLQFGHVT